MMPYFQGLLLGIAVTEGVWRLEVVVVVPDGNARWRATRPSFPCPLPARQGLRRQRGPRRSRRLQRPSMATSSVFVLFLGWLT